MKNIYVLLIALLLATGCASIQDYSSTDECKADAFEKVSKLSIPDNQKNQLTENLYKACSDYSEITEDEWDLTGLIEDGIRSLLFK